MRIITTFLTLLVLIFGQIPLLQAQNRSYNYFEPGYQLTPLLGSTANFFEFEAGRQLKSGFSFGAVSHWMVSDIRRTSVNGDEFLSSLWYAVPGYSIILLSAIAFYFMAAVHLASEQLTTGNMNLI